MICIIQGQHLLVTPSAVEVYKAHHVTSPEPLHVALDLMEETWKYQPSYGMSLTGQILALGDVLGCFMDHKLQ